MFSTFLSHYLMFSSFISECLHHLDMFLPLYTKDILLGCYYSINFCTERLLYRKYMYICFNYNLNHVYHFSIHKKGIHLRIFLTNEATLFFLNLCFFCFLCICYLSLLKSKHQYIYKAKASIKILSKCLE